MAERKTAAPTDRERRTGEGPEPKPTPTGPDDPESLRDQVAAAERQRNEYLDQLQRTQADFENYQKRNRRDQAEERRYAHAPFALELLPVLDNLQRALDAGRKESVESPVFQGVTLVQSQLVDMLRRFGITPIDPCGQQFDPALHEAVSREARDDIAPGTVAQVLEPGYRLHDRLLRPAKVVVATAER